MKELFRARSEENINFNKTVTSENDIRYLKSSLVSGSYRATQLWNNIISHLKANVELKRHRYKMRQYENSFTGKQAVDVIYEYILNNRDAFSSDVNRNNCIKLCQSFMDKKVFESVACRDGDSKKATFESSSNKVYRFKGSSSDEEVSSSSDDDDQPRDQDLDDLGYDEEAMRPVSSLVFDDDDMMNQTFMEVDGCKKTNKYNLQNEIAKGVPTEVEKEVRQEVALGELLKLIDLPVVDGLLVDDSSNEQRRQMDTSKNICSSLRHRFKDQWISNALDCIDSIQSSTPLLEPTLLNESQQKLKIHLFNILADHYGSTEKPLLPERFIYINLTILNLVLQEKGSITTKALQLTMMLLPTETRNELLCLIRFLDVAYKDDSCLLQREDANLDFIVDLFTNSILKHDVLAEKLASILVYFMILNVDSVFRHPTSLDEKARLRMEQLNIGQSPTLEEAFCAQVANEEYSRQMMDSTEKSLLSLLSSILSDPALSIEEKTQKIRIFQKCHPNISMRGQFPDMINSLF